jgi:N-carbamoylputrescine amidase
MTRVGAVQWPDGLQGVSEAWTGLAADVAAAAPELLITNEMPFGSWLPRSLPFDRAAARAWADMHEAALPVLGRLAPAVISSRPVFHGDVLANEAFAIEDGVYRALHHKQIFPAEEGWQEDAWFAPSLRGFETHVIAGLTVGVLLCTELMFPEHARALGRQGAHLIAVPRASGRTMTTWRTAGAMAAIVSGAYVLSSNRVGSANGQSPVFGGQGFAFAPTAATLGETSRGTEMLVVDVDRDVADAAKSAYPVYVSDRHVRP